MATLMLVVFVVVLAAVHAMHWIKITKIESAIDGNHNIHSHTQSLVVKR